MIKHLSVLAVLSLIFLVTSQNDCQGQGFGGYHGAALTARNVNVARGINIGVRASAYRPGGYRGPGYGAYGYRGPGYRNYGYAAFPAGSYVDGGAVILPPAPGKGPVGIDSIGTGAEKGASNLRSSSQAALNQSLEHVRLPSDAGLPANRPAETEQRK